MSTDTDSYKVATTDELYAYLQNNMRILKTVALLIYGDDPYPDPREIADAFLIIPMNAYLATMAEQKDEILTNLDLLSTLADVARENVEIHRELISRV